MTSSGAYAQSSYLTNVCVRVCVQDGGHPSENPRSQQPGGPADWEGGPQLEEDRGGYRDQDYHLLVSRLVVLHLHLQDTHTRTKHLYDGGIVQ